MTDLRKSKKLTQRYLRKRLNYNPDTGVFIWKSSSKMTKYWNTRYANKTAGCLTPNGYIIICIDRNDYLAHRLAFLWVKNLWPKYQIDHIDGNPSNNKWSNLRQATSSQNQFNCKLYENNKTGFKGVHLDTRSKTYHAQISAYGKRIRIGGFATPNEAHLTLVQIRKNLHKEYGRDY